MAKRESPISCTRTIATVFIIVLIAFTLYISPEFLQYETSLKKSDAVILAVGPDYSARKRGARLLIDDGFADCLMVPAKGSISKAEESGSRKTEVRGQKTEIDGQTAAVGGQSRKHSHQNAVGKGKRPIVLKTEHFSAKRPSGHFDLFENTHLEIIYARQMMEAQGFRSAIFVSSPCHMRRIKIIADRAFEGGSYELSYVPTTFEETCGPFWWTDKYCIKWVLGEYIKILWFLIYEPFSVP